MAARGRTTTTPSRTATGTAYGSQAGPGRWAEDRPGPERRPGALRPRGKRSSGYRRPSASEPSVGRPGVGPTDTRGRRRAPVSRLTSTPTTPYAGPLRPRGPRPRDVCTRRTGTSTRRRPAGGTRSVGRSRPASVSRYPRDTLSSQSVHRTPTTILSDTSTPKRPVLSPEKGWRVSQKCASGSGTVGKELGFEEPRRPGSGSGGRGNRDTTDGQCLVKRQPETLSWTRNSEGRCSR